MNPYISLNCWEIMNCDNLDCPARSEPDKPCWEIAKRMGDFRNVSNTCQDCVVFLLKNNPTVLSEKELQEILRQKGLPKRTGTGNPVCSLKTAANS